MGACRPNFKARALGHPDPWPYVTVFDLGSYTAGALQGQDGWDDGGTGDGYLVTATGLKIQNVADGAFMTRAMPTTGSVPDLSGPFWMRLSVLGLVRGPNAQAAEFGFLGVGGIRINVPVGSGPLELITNIGTWSRTAALAGATSSSDTFLMQFDGDNVIVSNTAGIQFLGSIGPQGPAPFDTAALSGVDDRAGTPLRITGVYAGTVAP